VKHYNEGKTQALEQAEKLWKKVPVSELWLSGFPTMAAFIFRKIQLKKLVRNARSGSSFGREFCQTSALISAATQIAFFCTKD